MSVLEPFVKINFMNKRFVNLRVFAIILLFFAVYDAAAQQPAFESIKKSIKPAVKNGGLAIDSLFLWCPSVIKVGVTYHMFASAWPAKYGMAGWTQYSRCIRATSKNLFGPYVYQETVLEKRDGFWDSERVHNVKIVKSGPKFILYYISTANETGYAEATSITGPWKRSEKMVSFSNPAPLVKTDGSIYMLGRLSVKIGEAQVRTARACTAPSYQGPYTLVSDTVNLFPNNYELEDPTIWWANNQYNVICTDFAGKATGINKAGVQYYSADGVHYHLLTKEPVNTSSIAFDDGSVTKFKRVERPFVYVDEKGKVVACFLACMPDSGPGVIVVHPVDNYCPGK